MSRLDRYQYCKWCGAELIRKEEDSSFHDEVRVTLVCPKKRYGNYSIRAMFRRDKHTEEFVGFMETILNYDPITGERIQRDKRSK